LNEASHRVDAPIVQRDILKSNLLGEEINIDDLSPCDIYVCLIALRAYNYNSKLVIEDPEDEKKNEEIDLFEHLAYIKDLDFKPDHKIKVNVNGVKAVVGLPKYIIDYKISVYLQILSKRFDKLDDSLQESQKSEMFTEILAINIFKYVNELTVKAKKHQVIEMEVPQMLDICDNLPSPFFTEVTRQIQILAKIAVDPVTTTSSGKNIEIDADFFNVVN